MSTEEEEMTESGVSRRSFLKKAGVGVAGIAASSALLAACTSSDDDGGGDTTAAGGADDTSAEDGATTTAAAGIDEVDLAQSDLPDITWDMATSWPTSLPTLFGGAQVFADTVTRLTGGKFTINARAAGEIVPGLEVLPTVRDGGVPVGHTASYYYVGINPATQFGTAVPFGLNQRQQNAWLYQGGGLELMREFYAQEFGVIQFPAGNTGVQMGGWFTKEINSVGDLQGLKMRIPGISGQVFQALGAEQVTVAGGDILPSIETGAIDAAEWVGPFDDLTLGLDQLGSQLFYYHPGWWEPGPSLEVEIPLSAWNELPEQYQVAVEAASHVANTTMMASYDVLNPEALQTVKGFAEIREFSPEVLTAFKTETENVLDSIASSNPAFANILEPWRQFRDAVQEWHGLAETSMLRAGAL